jgi:hypothetical protein
MRWKITCIACEKKGLVRDDVDSLNVERNSVNVIMFLIECFYMGYGIILNFDYYYCLVQISFILRLLRFNYFNVWLLHSLNTAKKRAYYFCKFTFSNTNIHISLQAWRRKIVKGKKYTLIIIIIIIIIQDVLFKHVLWYFFLSLLWYFLPSRNSLT